MWTLGIIPQQTHFDVLCIFQVISTKAMHFPETNNPRSNAEHFTFTSSNKCNKVRGKDYEVKAFSRRLQA